MVEELSSGGFSGCDNLEILPDVLGSGALFPQGSNNHLKSLRISVSSALDGAQDILSS